MPISENYAKFGAQIEEMSGVPLTEENVTWLANILKNRCEYESVIDRVNKKPPMRFQRGGHLMTIDREGHKVLVDAQPVNVTVTEWNILLLLASNPGCVYERGRILCSVHPDPMSVKDSRIIDSHIKNLRRKLHEDARDPIWIIKEHGIGYKFSES